MLKNKRTVRQNVEAILAVFEEARADDKVLLVKYWKHIDKIDFSNFEREFMAKGTMAESIRRYRQSIQEDGLFLPSEEILQRRQRQAKSVRTSVRKLNTRK
jgi:hypothetical protein